MTLQKRTISINFGSGIDGKTDDKLTTKLLTADNAVIRKNGTIEKRLGFVSNTPWSYGAAIGSSPVKVFPFHDGEFVHTGYEAETSFPSEADWYSQGIQKRVGSFWLPGALTNPVYSAVVKTIQVADSAANHANVAVWNTALATVNMQPASGVVPYGIRTKTMDINTGVASDVASLFGAGAEQSRMVAINASRTVFHLLTQSGTSIVYVQSDATQPSTGAVLVSGAESTAPQFDVAVIGTKIYFAAKQVSTTGIVLGSYDTATFATATTVINGAVTADILSIVAPATGTARVRLIWGNATNNTAYQASYSLTLSQIQAPTAFTVGVPAYGPLTQLCGVENSGLTLVTVFTTQNSQTAGNPPMSLLGKDWSNTVTDQTVGTFSHTMGLVGYSLVAKPFLAQGKPIGVFHFSATANQHFAMCRRSSQVQPNVAPLARWAFGVAAGNWSASRAWLPEVVNVTTDVFYTVLRKASSFYSQNNQITSSIGADLVRLDFSQTAPTPFVEIAGSTFLGGGYLRDFDGSCETEVGFLSAPVMITASVTTTGGSVGASTGTGAYSLVVVKQATNGAGRVYRSQPSLPVTFNTSTSTSAVTVSWYDGVSARDVLPQHSYKTSYALFRTQANLSIYYRDSAFSITLAAGPGRSAYMSKSTSVADATLAGGDVIYTQGGALPNWTPGSCDVLFAHKNRLFCSDPSDETILRFSKDIVAGDGVAFAQSFAVRVSGKGKLTAGASLDSNGVVFREREIQAFSGDGPDDTGLGGQFSDGQLLYSDIGCINQRNLCRFRDGVVFKSADKGFYLLGRDLQLQYIGADVEDYNSKTVVSSEVVALAEAGASVEECRFLCSDGTLLTYNYYNGQWTTATLPGCTDAVYSGGRYIVVNPTTTVSATAKVFQQSLSTYVDAFSNTSVTYAMTIETGWIKTADVQGLQRIWKGNVLGESSGPGAIQLEIGYDFEAAYNESYSVAMSSLTAASYTGGATAAMQGNFAPVRQKCNAIRFKITDIPSAGNTSGVFKLTNISLECGVKSGLFKLPATKGI